MDGEMKKWISIKSSNEISNLFIHSYSNILKLRNSGGSILLLFFSASNHFLTHIKNMFYGVIIISSFEMNQTL